MIGENALVDTLFKQCFVKYIFIYWCMPYLAPRHNYNSNINNNYISQSISTTLTVTLQCPVTKKVNLL